MEQKGTLVALLFDRSHPVFSRMSSNTNKEFPVGRTLSGSTVEINLNRIN